jgi:hypothetical protein
LKSDYGATYRVEQSEVQLRVSASNLKFLLDEFTALLIDISKSCEIFEEEVDN